MQGAWHSVEYGPHARQKLANAEWRGDAVIGTELEPDHRVDVVASLIGEDDHRDIGARPDVAQQVEPVVLAETQFGIAKSGSLRARWLIIASRPGALKARIW